MKYLPWDRLQQDSNLYNGNRVFKQSVTFTVYRTFRKKLNWMPMLMNNGAIFHGDNEEQINIFLETILQQSKKFEESVSIALYDLRNTVHERFEALEEQYKVFEYHPYKNGLKGFLEDFIIFRNEIKEKTYSLGLIEPTSRKLLIPIILLDEDKVAELNNSKGLINVFHHFLNESNFERIYPFVLAPFAEGFPVNVIESFYWAAYLGDKNKDFCKNHLFPDYDDSYYSIQQVIIGLLYKKDSQRLITLHPHKFTPSEYYLKKEQKLQKEDENYKIFLDMLNDGSER